MSLRILVLLLTLAPWSRARADETLPIWAIVNLQARLDGAAPGMRAWFDSQVRRTDTGTQVLVRPGLGWAFGDVASVWAGYVWVPTFYDDGRPTRTEHRVWEQLLLTGKPVDALTLVSRTRIEHRFMEGSTQIGVRPRQLVRANWFPKRLDPVGFIGVEEVLIGANATDFGQPAGFDQNRLFLGLGIRLAAAGRVEVGYLQIVKPRDTVQVDHILQVALHLRPVWRPKAHVEDHEAPHAAASMMDTPAG